MPINRHYLTQRQKFDLMNLVQAEYQTRGETDQDFAKFAAEKLQVPEINGNHVWSSRDALDIPSTREKPVHLENRVAMVEKRLKELEDLVNQQVIRLKV